MNYLNVLLNDEGTYPSFLWALANRNSIIILIAKGHLFRHQTKQSRTKKTTERRFLTFNETVRLPLSSIERLIL